MKEMSPGLGPVFPRMDARISTDEPELPISGRSVGMVTSQRLRIVLSLIAKSLAK